MNTRIRPVTDLLLALAGPMVWAGHFFGVYLTEAVLCSPRGAPAPVRSIAVSLTVLALAVIVAFSIRQRHIDLTTGRSAARFFALPLTLLSLLAVLWTSLPLFLLPACAPGAA
jgi:hypothetical protein